MAPKQLQKISRDIVKKLGVQDLNVIVPVKDGTEKETNLNLYQGDIFRTNFEHYLRISAKCNLGEIAYLLGNKTGITFSNHYCDYGNYQSQLILYLKLKRYNALFIRNERKQASFLGAKVSNQLMEIEGVGYQKHISEISGVFMVNDSHLNLKVEAEYGADVSIETLGGDR